VIPAAVVLVGCSVADGDAEQPDHIRDRSVVLSRREWPLDE
jgi:hypothetical protein